MTAKRVRQKGRRRTAKTADVDLRVPAQSVLATIRRIKRTISAETDPEEQHRLRRLLNRTFRKVRRYRRALEDLQPTPFGGPAIEEQIQIFIMVEDEFRAPDRKPV